MENKNKKLYWKGIEQLTNDPEFVKYAHKEFAEYLPVKGDKTEGSGSSRRDFLKLMGFSLAAASLAACEAPVRKAIPYLNKPVDVDPGVPNFYASSFFNGSDYCSVVVKTREGRPIKVERNTLSNISGNGTSAQAEASVLSLYDKERLTGPVIGGEEVQWEELDNQIKTKLASIASGGGKLVLVSRTIISPSTRKVIELFRAKYPNTEVVTYDSISANGVLTANEMSFGQRLLPNYHFDKANVVVSFAADFLGTWINPTKFSSDFAQTRKLGRDKKEMSRLYAFESNLSLTGANADYRIPVRASKEGLLVAALYNELLKKAGQPAIQVASVQEASAIQKAANDLWSSRGRSIVVSGSNDENVQVVVNGINFLLGNYGNTIDVNNTLNLRSGNDSQMDKFIADLNSGQVNGVIFYNCNPVFDHPRGGEIVAGLAKTDLKISTSDRKDETAAEVEYIAPDHHYLESWNDAEPVRGTYSLVQPTISPLFNTRQTQDSLLLWAGQNTTYYDFLRESWRTDVFPTQNAIGNFETFWQQSLHDGIYAAENTGDSQVQFNANISAALSGISRNYKNDNQSPELVFYYKVAIGDGSQANNPWLQEMPDPISKACWDNYLTVSQSWAEANNIKMEEAKTKIAVLTIDGKEVKLPIMVQPGQANGTFGLALGYGRTSAGKVGNGVGVNAYPFVRKNNNHYSLARVEGIEIKATSEEYMLAQTQTHHTFMGRTNVVQEGTLAEYKSNPDAILERPKIATSGALAKKLGSSSQKVAPKAITLWKGHEYPNHHWAMAIDLNSCFGCGSCTVACQAENNVPVVGKQEVVNRREMHWIRIDRYYSSDAPEGDYKAMEKAAENPEVTFMPMLCQQCNNAPCETVCPVAATTHSTEGLNQMAYNRCIGTRYCANNCPYKVRRFNWFKYFENEKFAENTSMNNDLGRMVLNPDVVVRSRGVMEKCTFCVQRIQYGKLEAKKAGRKVKDGEVTPACAAACSTGAIVFGDLKDKNSRVSQLLELKDTGERMEVTDSRAYPVLEELNTSPNIWYFAKIRNKDEELA